MGIISLSKACALLLAAGYIGAEASVVSQIDSANDKVLRAASKRSDLFRRSTRIEPKYEAELAYIEEENGWNGRSIFASQLKVASKKPILNLEEIEHHLTGVQCHDGKMKLSFANPALATDAKMACHGNDGGLVITSHEGCNKDGERAVYKVHGVSHAEHDSILELSTVQAAWEQSFDRFTVDFGHTNDDHLLRRHDDFAKLRKRQDASVTVPPVSIPTDTPDNVNEVTFDLNWEVDDYTFKPEDFLAGLPAGFVPLPDLSNIPIEVGCKTCLTMGELVLSQGSIVIDVKQIDVVPDFFEGKDDKKDIGSVITGGFFEIEANNMEGYFELFAKPKATGSFMLKVLSLPVLGFAIPGVGRAGAIFEASLSADYDIEGGFEITYGMNLVVPNNSTVRMELTDITKSGIQGFPNTTLTPLPFSFDVKDVSAFISLALIPSVPIGFKFEEALDASISVDMELPRLDALITTIANADTSCADLDAAGAGLAAREVAPFANDTSSNATGTVDIGPLVLIEANVSMTVDIGFDLKFPLLPPPLDGTGTSAEIFSTMFPLSTQCLAPLAGWAPASEVYDPVGKGTTGLGVGTIGTGVGTIGTGIATGGSSIPESTPCSNSTLKRSVIPPPSYAQATAPPSQCNCEKQTTTVYVPPVATPSPPPYGNGTAPVQPPPSASGNGTPPTEFTGAAVPGAIPAMQWGSVGWQLGALGASVLFGALML